MNIKQLVKFSFLLISFLVVIIAATNSVILYQIKENNQSRTNISKLVSYQETMNNILIDATQSTNIKSLNLLKTNFSKYEKDFEDIKFKFIINDKNDFMDNFIKDIHKVKIISQNLNTLFNNEKDIEIAFDNIYNLQKEKILLYNHFKKDYPIEKKFRGELENIIEKTKDISLIKNFGDLKYYSKETLYQHKDKISLDKWLNKIYFIKKSINNKQIDSYIKIVQKIGNDTIRVKEIELLSGQVTKKILNIINLNKLVNKNIQNNINKLSSSFINTIYSTIIILLVFTITIIIIVAYKVNKNVGLSVDVIEAKVQDGLKEINQLNYEIETTQKEVVFTMGAIGETRSKETGNHVKRVAQYTKLLAVYYGLPEKEAEMLKQASPMHDIGKVGIPDSILNKPGRFDEDEREIMNTHAKLGYDMLKHSNRPLLKMATIVAYEHHEKWDGTGYPNKTKGDDIHIYGRITALADVFDALGSNRVYKKAWDDEKIFKLFKEEKGKHFDPKLIDIFFDNLDQFLKIRDSLQDDTIK